MESRKATEDSERRLGTLRLIAGDYRAFSDLRGDTPLRRRVLMLPRMLLNPSLHAVVLIRLSNGSPRWLHWFWRNILLWKHTSEVVYRPSIGPGLILPHPFGIGIAKNVQIGRGVMIMHNVTIGATLGSHDVPRIGDGVTILAHSLVFGGIEIGEGSVIGAGSFVDFDMPPYSIARAPKAELRTGRAAERIVRSLKGER
jgi:serine acetyltransferase